jgi:hypothetical protein
MKSDNVFIFGAGTSFDAGIPLMAGFIEKMRYFAFKGKIEGKLLSENDLKVFQKAKEIMDELDSYHGRAKFDDRNLEDILSLLAFNILGGKSYTQIKLENMIEAISRTIELSCNVKHDGNLNQLQNEGNVTYRYMWQNLFDCYDNGKSFPTIITLNYDLVLERSLLQSLIEVGRKNHKFDGIIIKYYFQNIKNDFSYKIFDTEFIVDHYGGPRMEVGRTLQICNESEINNPLIIEILKLHGSLNFPSNINAKLSFVNIQEQPFIIPPVSNKTLTVKSERIWRVALDRIGKCKNLFIVGYSQPKTDIYFQYFLKSALGPNLDFEKLIVFNPAFFSEKLNKEIETRYLDCFPEQLHNQIVFHPVDKFNSNVVKGSFTHFVQELQGENNILF